MLSDHDAAVLQSQIDAQLSKLGAQVSISLDSGADVMDLKENADVNVVSLSSGRRRMFHVITCAFALRVIKSPPAGPQADEDAPRFYVVPGPLCIVDKISGRAIVASVLAQMHMEKAWAVGE